MTFCLNNLKQDRGLPVKPSISNAIQAYLFRNKNYLYAINPNPI